MVDYSFSIRPAETNVVYLPFPTESVTGAATFLTAPVSGGTFTQVGTAYLAGNKSVISLGASESASITLPAFYQYKVGGTTVFSGKVSSATSESSSSGGPAETFGYAAWSCDPFVAQSSSAPAQLGRLLMTMVHVGKESTISKGYFNIAAAASGPISGQNFMGLYNSAGVLLGGGEIDTAHLTGAVDETNSLKTVPFTTVFSITPGKYWAGLLFNGTVGPSLYRAKPAFALAANGNLTTTQLRVCSNSSNITALPAIINTSANNPDPSIAFLHWVAIS